MTMTAAAARGRSGLAVSVVIPVRNGAADLSRCLAAVALASRGRRDVEVIVVDNGSSDGSADVARHLGARVLERPDIRVGACRNAGAAEARGDVLAFVDADNEIGPGWLDACCDALGVDDVAAAGYPYRPPADATWVQQRYDSLRDRPPVRQDVEWLAAGNFAVRRTVFTAVGGFDEELEACEDVQLCRVLRQAGHRVVSEPGMDSVHHGDPRTLTELFNGELWRGRDNLRVSLAGPLTLRALPNTLLPMLGLASLVLVVAGLVGWPWIGGTMAIIGVWGLATIATLKALVIIARGRLTRPGAWVQGFAVAAIYETARALSLVSGATHRTRVRIARHA
jgi:GT2 family glycosyltransferase